MRDDASNNDAKEELASVIGRFLEGNRRALARAITFVENEHPAGDLILEGVYSRGWRTRIIGFTGPPGGGKSSVVARLIPRFRRDGLLVAALLVDPSSPFTGGAILGDRIRMPAEITNDEGVFIRSMASRGQLGGLAKTTMSVIELIVCFGFDVILVETVGAGQSEVDIVKATDTVAVVSVPGLGDSVQTIKAGIMEIGDVFVVNKSDLPNASRTAHDIEASLDLSSEEFEWPAAVIPVSALKNEGIDELKDALDKHWEFLETSGKVNERRRNRLRDYLLDSSLAVFRSKIGKLASDDRTGFEELLSQVVDRELDPISAIKRLVASLDTRL